MQALIVCYRHSTYLTGVWSLIYTSAEHTVLQIRSTEVEFWIQALGRSGNRYYNWASKV